MCVLFSSSWWALCRSIFVQIEMVYEGTLYMHVCTISNGWWHIVCNYLNNLKRLMKAQTYRGMKERRYIVTFKHIFLYIFWLTMTRLVWFLFVDFMLQHWRSKWNKKSKLPSDLKKILFRTKKMFGNQKTKFLFGRFA